MSTSSIEGLTLSEARSHRAAQSIYIDAAPYTGRYLGDLVVDGATIARLKDDEGMIWVLRETGTHIMRFEDSLASLRNAESTLVTLFSGPEATFSGEHRYLLCEPHSDRFTAHTAETLRGWLFQSRSIRAMAIRAMEQR